MPGNSTHFGAPLISTGRAYSLCASDYSCHVNLTQNFKQASKMYASKQPIPQLSEPTLGCLRLGGLLLATCRSGLFLVASSC